MMFLNFFGAIPLLLPNIVWNVISILFIKQGEEYGFQFEMAWDHVIENDNVYYKGNASKSDDGFLIK